MATANLLQTSVSGGTQNALSLQGDGVFFPKASTTSRLALTLTTTDKGFIVYDTTDNNIYFWNGAAWESVPSSGDAGANGSVQYNDNGIVSGASNFTYNNATSAVSVAGDLTVDTSTLKVDSTNNRVGIGTASPSQPLHVRFDNAGPTTLALFENGIVDFASSAAGQIVVGARGYNYTVLRQNPDIGTTPAIGGVLDTVLANISALGNGKVILATASTARLIVHETTGDVSIANGNLVMTTSGKGIDFSATAGTGTSELLNDYEEGNWTVGLSDLFGNDATVSAQTGRYTKIGRRVFCFASITLSNKGAGSAGNLPYITGLPFAAVRTEGSVVQFYANTSLTTNGQINFQTTATNNVGNFTVSSSTAGTTFLTFGQITNTTQFVFCVSYDV